MANPSADRKPPSNFRRFFLRGLGILLPTILTIWILVVVYQFVDQKIADPINAGIRGSILNYSQWPEARAEHRLMLGRDKIFEALSESEKVQWSKIPENQQQLWLDQRARRLTLEQMWEKASIGNWAVLDLIGLLIAIVLIYTIGFLLGGFIGRSIIRRVEQLIRQIPIVKAIYPSVKQVTDFLFGGEEQEKLRFDRVVAVEYPRKGVWSVGMVTGDTMSAIQGRAGVACVTVFVPSSPTPFTGYTITVPVTDTIELPVTIDDALRFTVSGGVLVPDSQLIGRANATATPTASPLSQKQTT